MILILLTGVLERGGIQRVSKHYSSILTKFANKNNLKVYLISLNDNSDVKGFEFNKNYYNLKSCGGNKIKFCFYAVYFGLKSKLLFSNHKSLAIICKLIKTLKPSIDYIILAHGREIWDYPPSWITKLSFNNAYKIIAVSNYTKSKIIDIYQLDNNKIQVINNALDPDFSFSNEIEMDLPIPQDSIFLLTVCRLNKSEPGKGVDTVLKSLPKVLEKVSNLIYIIVGKGDLIKELSNLVVKLRINKNVIFIQDISDEILKEYFKRCEIFVMPSIQEGFGLVFIEAMYYRKPVIGCEQGGVMDIIENGINGYLIEENNSNQLSEYIIKLLTDKEIYTYLAFNAEKTVHEKFIFNTFEEKITNLLDNIYSEDINS